MTLKSFKRLTQAIGITICIFGVLSLLFYAAQFLIACYGWSAFITLFFMLICVGVVYSILLYNDI